MHALVLTAAYWMPAPPKMGVWLLDRLQHSEPWATLFMVIVEGFPVVEK